MNRPVAVITGAAQGIGLETARRLSATHRVALLDVDSGRLPDAAAACGADAIHTTCDITVQEQVDAAVAFVVDQAGGIDVAISNAGIAAGGTLRHIDPDVLHTVLNVNLVGNWRFIHACLPQLVECRGYVLGVASAAAIAPTVGIGQYCASKAGLEMLLDVLRLELDHLGVDVGCAYFLFIDTDMVRGAERDLPEFAHMRQKLARPLRGVLPVAAAADAIVEAVRERRSKAVAPGFVRAISPARMALRTRVANRDALSLAPELDRLTADRVAELGAYAAAMRTTPAMRAAAASSGRELGDA